MSVLLMVITILAVLLLVYVLVHYLARNHQTPNQHRR